jgi:prepilin-type N-terminal cleavage/methylation domain-containing protein/prepilin-type processing-associated H-X9-DG protein
LDGRFPPRAEGRRALTLIELLVVIALLAILAALILPGVARGLDSARTSQCANNLRQLGMAVLLFAEQHKDAFPRSQHSAFAHGDIPWERSLAPELSSSAADWKLLLKGVYHCPADARALALSYGLNVYFELGDEDDYAGKPQIWRRRADIPRPGSTILFAENASLADHIMPHFWSAPRDAVDVDARRHRPKANYAFVDGHVALHDFAETYSESVDWWNPAGRL